MTELLISSTILIAVILLLRLLLRNRVSHRLQYGLWLLVALRLLIPVQFGQSQYSVATLTQQAAQTPPAQQLQQTMDQPIAGPSRSELYEQLLQDYLAEKPQQQVVPSQVQTQLRQEAEAQSVAPSLSQILTAVWICGAAVMGIWFLATNILFLHRAKKNSAPCPGDWAPIPVRICPHVPTPCLVGLFRPQICLTPASAGEDTRTHVLTHEITHLRHFDHLWAWVRCICLCLYWFHPLVWVAAILSRRDCELACDEGALKQLGDHQRIPYGKTLLAIVTQSSSPAHLLETATAMNESKRQLKERVENIVKKPRNILFAAISMVLVTAIAAGCAFSGGKPTEPASSSIPEEKENSQILIDLAHEAENIVAQNNTITLDSHYYITEYIRYNSDKFTQAATVTDTTVTLNREYIQYCIPLDDGDVITHLVVNLTEDFQYLTFLDLLMDRYSDSLTPIDIHYEATFNRKYFPTLFFYPQYRNAGYDTVAALWKAIDAGTASTPDYSFLISYDRASICWATDPDRPLTEEDVPSPTQPTLPSQITEPTNTEGPPIDPISPVDADAHFSGNKLWYSMALQSTYVTAQQLDLSAYFAYGFGDEEPITGEEWSLLQNTPGFLRDDNLHRLPTDKMEAVLEEVFGMGLEEFDGVGMEQMVYLEETNCYYLYAPKPTMVEFSILEVRPTYMEYLDKQNRHYRVNLDVTEYRSGYRYHITSHTMDEGDQLLATADLASQLGMSYVQFLYDSTQFIQAEMIKNGITDPALLLQAETDAMDMYSRSLYLRDGKIMLRFRYLTFGESPLNRTNSVLFVTTGVCAEETAYQWLFDLSGKTDGAQSESYYPLLANVLFLDPEGFIRSLTNCDAATVDFIGTYLPLFGLVPDEEVLYETLLTSLSTEETLTEAERNTVLQLLRYLQGQSGEPQVSYETQHAIACYAAYRAIGTYCYRELNTEDMSSFLTEEQKKIYCGQQMQILCCHTPEEMLEHAHSLLDDSLLTEDPTDRLFTDVKGNLYLIVIPMGTISYDHIQQVGNNSYYAGAYNENGYIYTVSFTFSADGKLKQVLPLDANASERLQTFQYLNFYLNDFFTVTKGDKLTFSNGIIEGAVYHSNDGAQWKTSRNYALQLLRNQEAAYPQCWMGEYGREVYYTVFMDEEITFVEAAYVDGDNLWTVTLQSPTSAGRLAQMIHIATSGFL